MATRALSTTCAYVCLAAAPVSHAPRSSKSAAPRVAASRAAARLSSKRNPTVCVMTPERMESASVGPACDRMKIDLPEVTVSKAAIQSLEAELDAGESVKALRRFNDLLEGLSAEQLDTQMWRVWNEMAYNLESFNPVFTACLLKVQCTLGATDYVRRDECLRSLIQPLAGEYGMHNGEPMGKTHRKLFSEFYTSVTGESLEGLLSQGVRPAASEHLFACMMRDITTGGGHTDGIKQASYALGYNLAVEYLAAYEKTWLLESFHTLDRNVLAAQGKVVDWLFLDVHATGEPEHAELGHASVAALVPASHTDVLREAMHAHDRDFAHYYNELCNMLEK